MSLWQKISSAFGHKEDRSAMGEPEAHSVNRRLGGDDLVQDEALEGDQTTGVSYTGGLEEHLAEERETQGDQARNEGTAGNPEARVPPAQSGLPYVRER